MSNELDLSKKKILIIDDQKTFQVMLKTMLLNLGALQVVAVSSGEAGLAAHKQHHFDVLLVDYNLGRGKNGRQVLEELRVLELLRPDGVFILVSGENNKPMVLSAIELQPDDYLMKPFSNNVLRSRLTRSFRKRIALRKVYQALYRQKYSECLQACKEHIDSGGRYKNFCLQLSTELNMKTGKLNDAEKSVKALLSEQRFSWGVLALAKIKYAQGQFEVAIPLLDEVIKNNPNGADAYDLKAQALDKLDKQEEALDPARRAVTLAPFSLNRQLYMADLARRNGEFELAKQAMYHVVEISRKSVHRDPKYLCTYIRSILDAAENGEDSKQVSKYQQEASLALHRAKTDELLVYSKFDYKTLESAVFARINAFNGQLREAQSNMKGIVAGFLEQGHEVPPEIAPDIIIALLDIGEFERAELLADGLSDEAIYDNYNKKLLESRIEKCKEQRKSFVEANKLGIKAYTEGDYKESLKHFEVALKQAPMNSGASLNYVQAAIKVMMDDDQHSQYLLDGCKRCFRTIEGLTLPEAHQKRLKQIKTDYQGVTGIKV
ncbi:MULTISPECIES: response regulator [Gammaproteobacteria]|uniref:response regulator n=1 Tax=Gammaproteobacteria TaxID=1236 RepID=UPI000DD0C199|nr:MULTISPECIES: response regulator [Gammaproteobacteria]RTE87009.1 response regulator [Aliidiomarina sp. B3213]TCZ93201.1 response regulator [Lysobacter sp. N42]